MLWFQGATLITFILLCFFLCVLYHKQLLFTLLSLEFLVLNTFYVLCIIECYSNFQMILFYLVMCVCEGALGLSLLVKFMRTFKSSSLGSQNVSLW